MNENILDEIPFYFWIILSFALFFGILINIFNLIKGVLKFENY